MNNTNEPVGISKGLSTLERPRFGPGMLLHHEDLEQLNIYTRSLSRLLFQSFFGCGVICGLVIEEVVEECKKLKVTIKPGVALSCAGDPVYVPATKDVFTKEGLELDVNLKLWVVLCGTTKCCAPRVTSCSCDDDETASDCTREKDAFEIRLMLEAPKCACACLPPKDGEELPPLPADDHCLCSGKKCHEDHYAGICGCTCGECTGCDCKCILLASIEKIGDTEEWKVDHSVRRFIRPVLMRDPQPEHDKAALASGGDPGIAKSLDTLSGEFPEKEMGRVRASLKAFTEPEKALLIQILEAVPDQTEKALLLHEIATKYHDDKLGINIPRERRNLITRLKGDLSEAQKRGRSGSKGQKTK
jgi:hypothetical protein